MISPTPWTIDYDERDDGVDQIISSDGLTICFMSTPAEDHEDDALLIIAAPKLLEACKELILVADLLFPTGSSYRVIIAQAKAAIAAAGNQEDDNVSDL